MKYINEYNEYEKKLFNAAENIKSIKGNKLYELLIRYLKDKNIKYKTFHSGKEYPKEKQLSHQLVITFLGNYDCIVIEADAKTDKILDVQYKVTAEPNNFYTVSSNTIQTFNELFKLIDKHIK